ncbi:MAG: 2-oxo acid dehydrogenase subunit E2 [Chloroflexota bacterium]
MYEFRLPDVGEGIHEAEIGEWLVAVGDVVKLDQPVLEVETDKSVVELPAPIAGRVVKIGLETGTLARVGELLLVIEPVDSKRSVVISEQSTGDGGQPSDSTVSRTSFASLQPVGLASPSQRILAAPSVRKLALELGVDLTAVSGSGPAGRILASDVREAVNSGQLSVNSEQVAKDTHDALRITQSVLAAPAVRKKAQDLGVDLAVVNGTAEKGRVTMEDLERFVAERETAVSQPAQSTQTMPTEASERVALRGIRRSMARRMEESWQTIPHVTNFEDIDATELITLRQVLKGEAEARGLKLTYLPIMAKITAQLLTDFPDFNASIDMVAQEILYHRYIHLGIATATPDGLLVPVVKYANQLSIFELAEQINALAEQARTRKLPPSALSGSTFTITNFGSFGGNLGTPIINPPEVAILGSGRIAKKPVVIDDELVIRPILPIALSFDHRLIDGAMAGSFLTRLRQLLERPQQLLLDLK